MNLSNLLFLLSSGPVIEGGKPLGEAAAQTAQAVAPAAEQAAQNVPQAGISPIIIVAYIAVFGALWFFTIRPQKKREKALAQLQESLKVGDNIITSSGFYGRIVDTGSDHFVVEFGTNKGVRIPVRKLDIIGVKELGSSIESSAKDEKK